MSFQAPRVFLPYQADVINDPSRVRIIEKSRRIGFSWAIAGDCVLDAASVNGADTFYVAYNKEGAQSFIEDAAQWARWLTAAGSRQEYVLDDDDPDRHILAYSLTLASGYAITALSSRPSNLRGKKGRIVIDEAAFHHDLEGLMASAMGVLQWEGALDRVDIISTHYGADNPFNILVEDARMRPKKNQRLHRITFDDALAQGFYRRVCLKSGKTWSAEAEAEYREYIRGLYRDNAEQELDCIPSKSGGMYFDSSTIDRAMEHGGTVARLSLGNDFKHWKAELRKQTIETWLRENVQPLLAKIPRDAPYAFGCDFGRKADRTVMVPGYMLQDRRRCVPFVIELLNCPFEQQRQIVTWLFQRIPNLYFAAFDANGIGADLAEHASQMMGPQLVEEVHINGPWYNENLPPLKAAFDDEVLIIPSDRDHLSDFMAVKRIKGEPRIPETKNESTDGPPRHGDGAVGYAMFYYASRKPLLGKGDYTSAKANAVGAVPQTKGLPMRPDKDKNEAITNMRAARSGGLF